MEDLRGTVIGAGGKQRVGGVIRRPAHGRAVVPQRLVRIVAQVQIIPAWGFVELCKTLKPSKP
jgi:hypothetical protein